MVQFIGFPAALVFGRLGERYGPRRGIWIAIWVYVGVTIYAYFMDSAVEMYILAGVIGLVQGGIQALSRSMFSQLIPADKNAEFFGFYNVVGKAAAVGGESVDVRCLEILRLGPVTANIAETKVIRHDDDDV